MTAPIDVAINAARAAQQVIDTATQAHRQQHAEAQTTRELVSTVDRAAEHAIIQEIRRHFPNHAILAEESGVSGTDASWRWIIDPMDGSINFAHGFPYFGISIAVQHRGETVAACVMNVPTGDLFTAERGAGAFSNGEAMRVSNATSISDALIGTAFPTREHAAMDDYLQIFSAMIRDALAMRRAGAAALDLANVASGHLDGFWMMSLKAWDAAAGALLVEEAGGKVCDFSGGDQFLQTNQVIAANRELLIEMAPYFKPFSRVQSEQ